MLFAKALPLALAATALASPLSIVKRDLATIQAAFSSISSAVGALDSGINGLSASTDPQQGISTLTGLSGSVISALKAGTSSVSGTSALSLADSVSLLSSSNTLVSAVDKTVSDLIAKKSIVDAASADSIVVGQLQDQRTASQAFIAAVVSKVPSSVADLANSQAQSVITSLNRGITAFGGTP